MREILFRGKRVDNGAWIEGFYIEDRWGDSNGNELHGILQDRTCPPGLADWIPISVIPETVGQYTGLSDKNGKNIFEGDVVKQKSGLNQGREIVIAKVVFAKNAQFLLRHKIQKGWDKGKTRNYSIWKDSEIIGNIHDNPELLEVEE